VAAELSPSGAGGTAKFLDSFANLSNSLHDENDDAYDNDGSDDPVSEHFDSPYVFLCAVINTRMPCWDNPPSAFHSARAWPLNGAAGAQS
jgi:hypothetical protein